jgi:hypothetical protein
VVLSAGYGVSAEGVRGAAGAGIGNMVQDREVAGCCCSIQGIEG